MNLQQVHLGIVTTKGINMKKETIKKGNKTISIYELKVDAKTIKDVLTDIQKSYLNKVITIKVES